VSNEVFSMDNLTPPDMVACTWRADWLYVPGDYAAGSDGAIYECWDLAYCDNDPTTDRGAIGWFSSPFTTSGIAGYDASTCEPELHYADMGTPGFLQNLPYKTGDVLYDSNDFYICTETLACRLIADPDWSDSGIFDSSYDDLA